MKPIERAEQLDKLPKAKLVKMLMRLLGLAGNWGFEALTHRTLAATIQALEVEPPRCRCAEVYGPKIPTTDEEIEAFEREHGPPEPLSEEFMEGVTQAVLKKIEATKKRCRKKNHPRMEGTDFCECGHAMFTDGVK